MSLRRFPTVDDIAKPQATFSDYAKNTIEQTLLTHLILFM